MSFAIIETGGKQYKVSASNILEIEKLDAEKGKTIQCKNVLVFSPAFTADCLETIIEIGDEYKELFIEANGKNLDYVESLNYSDLWVDAIIDIIS